MSNHDHDSLTHVPRKATLALLAAVCASASSCALLIPPDPSIPRNNTVEGGPHRPQMNPGGNTPMGMKPQAAASAPTLTAMNTPPTPAATEPAAMAPAPQQQAMLAPPPVPPQYRGVPVENEQALQLAGNYPPIDAVPPRPVMTGPDSSQQHLKDARSELESARDAAAASKDKLERDVSGEPSMVGAPPAAAVPTASPTPQTPVPEDKAPKAAPTQAPTVSSPTSSVAPAQPVARAIPAATAPVVPVKSASAALLPVSAQFAPPPPKPGMMQLANAKANRSSSAPETLMDRVEVNPAPAARAMVGANTAFADIAVQKGDFNPLVDDAAAAAASLAGATSGR